MKKSQAKGYLLEIVLAKLLKVNGYDLVTSSDNEIRILERNGLNVKGRGGYHQFDSLGTFRITPPFVYPIRLFLEAKFYTNKVGIDRIRMGIGILQDVNTNYFTVKMTNEELNLPKYNYNYAIFSTSGFTGDAQRLALAHKIRLIDLSSGYYSWIRFFINQIVDRLFTYHSNNGDDISSDIFNDFKEEFSSWINNLRGNQLDRWFDFGIQQAVVYEFVNQMQNVRSIYIASTKSSQIIALIPDNDDEFRNSLLRNPHQEVTITWNENENDVWIVRPTRNYDQYRLTFQLPAIIRDYIFNNSVNQYDSAYDEKRRSFGMLSFIAYLEDENPTLCTLKFNEEETRILVDRYNQQFRLENQHD